MVGLPGAGKSHYLDDLVGDGTVSHYYDDFHAGAREDKPCLGASRHADCLVRRLREGKSCAIADVAYCDPARRLRITEELKGAIPGLEPVFHYFASDETRCARNICARGRESLKADLETLAEFASRYEIPEDAHVLDVWVGDE